MWWCCGRVGENAVGCISSKHVPRDEEEELLETQEQEENEKALLAQTKCYSCREFGHRIVFCEKDPNIRSFYETEMELDRVTQVRKKKIKNDEDYIETMGFVLSS
jgi:hypothetical protein